MSRLLALDQSSKVTGWAIFQDGLLEKNGKFSFEDANPIIRLVKLQDATEKLIEDENIEEVAIEEIQMQGNINNVVTFKILAFTMASILLLCERKSLPVKVIASSTWKSVCGVKGRVRADQKRDAQRFVLEEFGIKAIQDIVDAICLGYCVTKEERGRVDWV